MQYEYVSGMQDVYVNYFRMGQDWEARPEYERPFLAPVTPWSMAIDGSMYGLLDVPINLIRKGIFNLHAWVHACIDPYLHYTPLSRCRACEYVRA